MLTLMLIAQLALASVGRPTAPTQTARYTDSDLKDVWCMSYCENRDYNMGWSIPTGCRCSDDFKLADKPFKLPNNLNGRMVGDTPPTYYIIRETN